MTFLDQRTRFHLCILVACCSLIPAAAAARTEIDLTGKRWRLWLDGTAEWKSDPLFFPAPPLEKLPINPPTGGWAALGTSQGMDVSVPGTVEEYHQKISGPDGDLLGVSWWFRTVDLPAIPKGHRVILRFDSIRQRAEIFINHRLAGYDVVGNSPIEVDISKFIAAGGRCEIAVRVTDPAGNFDWRDSQAMRWGNYSLPLSHGFGGITGRVRLVICDPIYIDDIYVQNTPAITEANAFVTIRNTTERESRRDIEVRVRGRDQKAEPVFQTTLKDVVLPTGDTTIPLKIVAPKAALWDVDHPNLYACEATLRSSGEKSADDSDRRTFGFRWFAAENIGQDAIFRLNGRRIVIRSAISWGFWPINGIYPTEALAEQQVRIAKELGLNMLNFHRAIGNPAVFEKANELGLLYFEEPGAHKSVDRDPFGRQLAREKLLRMVRRDRSHPSLVIYNLINEWDSRNPNPDPAEIARHRDDMSAAHAIDPSRTILHTSAWARGKDIDDPAKLHFRPFDSTPYLNGWYDVHHAGGPATWNESLYRSPTDFYGVTDNMREIVFWGEEGALSTPPRLEKIKAALDASPHAGWDGGLYQEWFRDFDHFLTSKKLRSAFPTVDSLTSAMGAVSLLHQGRRIENMRMSNVGDGYAINGWEAQIIENHSGVVDCFRNPKGDPAILSYYNQPLYVAVKVRTTVLQAPGEIVADFFAINEKNLRGPFQMRATLRDGEGKEVSRVDLPVNLEGGETYGQLLAENVKLPVGAIHLGALKLEASLTDATGAEHARGHDDIWTVDWKQDAISSAGAVWESGGNVGKFLLREKEITVPAYAENLGRLDWIVVSSPPLESEPVTVPSENLQTPDGKNSGLRATFSSDPQFRNEVHQRVDATVSYAVEDGAAPDPALSVMNNYAVRWEGAIKPVRAGRYTFVIQTSGAARLIIDGQTVIDARSAGSLQTVRGTIELKADSLSAIALEFRQNRGNARCALSWIAPGTEPSFAPSILDRVARDGTTLVILDHAESWMPLLAQMPGSTLQYKGSFKVGRTWLGGVHFAREHDLLRGLPVNVAMDWPYQNVVRDGNERLGLQLEGEELAAGCYHSYPMQLGTAVGVIPVGRGRVVFSTLDIVRNLNAKEGPAHVARKLLCNFLRYGPSTPPQEFPAPRP